MNKSKHNDANLEDQFFFFTSPLMTTNLAMVAVFDADNNCGVRTVTVPSLAFKSKAFENTTSCNEI